MNEYPRRRRLEPEPPKGGGLPIIPLVVLVIFGGLFLGGLLTKFFGNSSGTHAPASVPSFTPLPEPSGSALSQVTPAVLSPSPLPSPHPVASVSPHQSPSSRPSATPKATPSPTPKPTPERTSTPRPVRTTKPTPKPTLKPVAKATTGVRVVPSVIFITAAPSPSRQPTIAPSRTPVVTPTPVLITGTVSANHAAAIVRSYVASLARGDSATAAGYLASGIPDESFINPNVSVSLASVNAARNGDGSFTVTAQIVTSKGSYLETFTLRPDPYGMQITDHNATRM